MLLNSQKNKIPEHICIVLDGNGRWAKKRGLPRMAGHIAGAKNVKKIARYCSKIGVKYLTLYCFSTENWRRPQEEVAGLMKIFKQYLEDTIKNFDFENMRIKFLGNRTAFSADLQSLINKVDERMQNLPHKSDGMVINLALNYGGKAEIVRAAKQISQKVKNNEVNIDDIDEKMFAENLYTSGQPDVDLFIRPSGEFRVSNFMLWQAAYAEFIILDVLWPDFSEKDIDFAIESFSKRDRRFGGV